MKRKVFLNLVAAALLTPVAVFAQQAENSDAETPAAVEVTRVALGDDAVIGCTQLEFAANVEHEECGTMALAEIVKYMHPPSAD